MDNIEISPSDRFDLFKIQCESLLIKGINNNILYEEILKDLTPMSEDIYSSLNEDNVFDKSKGIESKKLLDVVDKLANERGLKSTYQWAVSHRHLESTDIHNHYDPISNVCFAWCYYVRVPENSGDLVFILNNHINQVILRPHEGLFIIFPAWLKHKVSKNLNKNNRVVVSGNMVTA